MTTKLKKGLKKTKEIWGYERLDLQNDYEELGEFILETAFGEVYSRPGLALRDRELITIAMLVAQGGAENQLRNHFLGALNLGIKKEELMELILQSSLYNGFPKAIQAKKLLNQVLNELQKA